MPSIWILAAWFFGVLGTLLALGALGRRFLDNPREDAEAGFIVGLMRVYVRFVHRLRVDGRENVPDDIWYGPLIVVSNHTAGVDPLILQSACPFEIRWMMALDQRLPIFEAFWNWARIIDVDREHGDPASARTALQHLEDGGVVGIFAEGGIERPVKQILPFMPGVGLLIKKSKAPVLCAIIEDTPAVDPAWASLTRRSRSRVTFMPMIDYSGSKLGARQIAEDLRARYTEWTGWPANDNPEAGVSPTNL